MMLDPDMPSAAIAPALGERADALGHAAAGL